MAEAIKIKGLVKVYASYGWQEDVIALDGIDLDINSGEIFGLLGPNGSGKTTLIKILLGLLFPTAGEVRIFAKDARDIAIRARLGYLPEFPRFYHFLTPVELLHFYGKLCGMADKERAARVESLLEIVGLSEQRRKRVGQFSKGMLQRVGLATALINDPDILLLDEPTIGLDPVGARQIKDLLFKLKGEGKTILLSSHLLSEIETACDRIGILNRGKLVEVGELSRLLSRKDELQVITGPLSEKAKERIAKVITEEGSSIREIGHPRESLESLFIKLVGKKQ